MLTLNSKYKLGTSHFKMRVLSNFVPILLIDWWVVNLNRGIEDIAVPKKDIERPFKVITWFYQQTFSYYSIDKNTCVEIP